MSRGPAGIAVNPLTNTVYVGKSDGHRVAVIDAATDSVVKLVGPFGCCALTPSLVSTDPITNRLYAVNIDDNHLYSTFGRANVVNSSNPLDLNPEFIATNPLTNTVYLADSFTPEVLAVNGRTKRVKARIALPNDASGAVATNPLTNRVYVADGFDLLVINALKNKVIAATPLGAYSDVATNPLTDTIYVADAFNHTVSVINGHTNKVTASVSFGQFANDVDIDLSTNQAYVTFQHGVKVIAGLPG